MPTSAAKAVSCERPYRSAEALRHPKTQIFLRTIGKDGIKVGMSPQTRLHVLACSYKPTSWELKIRQRIKQIRASAAA